MANAQHPPATFLEDLIDPQVLADMIRFKLTNYMRFAPLATIDNSLQGSPGSTISLPRFVYPGNAVVVAEGQDIPIQQLKATSVEVTIYKAATAYEITDEAILSAYGDPVGTIVEYIAHGVAKKIDLDVLNTIDTDATLIYTGKATDTMVNAVSSALTLFGEDNEGVKVLVISPERYEELRNTTNWIPNTEIGADMLIRGTVGMVHGCQVVVSEDIDETKAFIVKPGALYIFRKTDFFVETDRNILNQTNLFTGTEHFVPHLYDETKAVKLDLTAVPVLSAVTPTP